MPVAVAGNVVKQPYLFLDADGVTPLVGATTPADITFALKRYTSSGTVAASETVTFVALGSGYYDITFTPENSGLYSLFSVEVTGAQRPREFYFDILSAGATYLPSYANAFCSESDIERWLQFSIDASTNPNDTETAGFAQTRANVLMSLCASLGYTVTPSTVTAGSRLESLLRDANAIGAALDYSIAQQFRQSPSRSERIDYLLGQWQQYYGPGPFEGTPGAKPAGPGYIEIEIRGNLTSLATDHILSGDTIASTPTYPTDVGPGAGGAVSMSSKF